MTLFLATRPAFLSITLLAVFLGIAHAWASGATPSILLSALTLSGALLAHAGANVFNDVHDAQNGTDARNTERVAPFTGGSRFIQDGTLSSNAMRRLAWTQFAASMLIGLALLALTDERLMLFGLLGLLLAIAYSAPPLALMSRGLGELAVGAAWGLIVAGSDFVARRTLDPNIVWLALPFGFQIMLILLANQVPDYASDRAVGKRNWVVRCGRDRAALLYRLVLAGAGLSIAIGVVLQQLPLFALSCLLALPLGLVAANDIARHSHDTAKLRRSIILTLISAHLSGLLLIASLIADHLMKSSP